MSDTTDPQEAADSGLPSHDLLAHPRMRLSIVEARIQKVCRVCLKPANPSPDNPFVYDYGDEHSHRKCLRKVWG